MTRCPHCFHRLSTDVFAWVCVSGRCPTQHDLEASRLHGAPVAVGPVVVVARPSPAPRGWVPPVTIDCPTCGVGDREACPDCHYLLPADWRDGEAMCIAMAGARATGKSVYVGVLVKQLGQLAERLGTTLAPANERTESVYRSVYERALFEQRGLIEPTPAAHTQDSYQREPLVYSLGILGGRRRFIVLRDVAGEDMEAPSSEMPHLGFFAHADGVIFMFDPLRVPEIRDQLHDLVPAELHSGGDPLAVLTKVLRMVGEGPAMIAVVLSKFDAMQALRSVSGTAWNRVMSNSGAAFLRDAGVGAGGYDDEDGQLLSLEVRSLLQRLGAGALVTSLERPHRGQRINHRFFAVSALGEPADGESLHERGISPFRCLDPVRWVMSSVGALPR
jgi:hypothetical protein